MRATVRKTPRSGFLVGIGVTFAELIGSPFDFVDG